jgi:aminopeptidase N
VRAVAALVASTVLLAGCTSLADRPDASPSPGPPASAAAVGTPTSGQVAEGYSVPVEDRVYPDVGDPGVDTLHYDLHLTWTPRTGTLEGVETVDLRATADAKSFRLDLGQPLTVSRLTVDRKDTTFTHDGKDLVVQAPVAAEQRYTLRLRYAGTPEPVPAPVIRRDFDETGWTRTSDGGAWTMQEPFGAYTWYAVNDQPSDKALYDITISVPAPMVGVANGELLSRTRDGADTVTSWRLDEPAASYLVTVAVGRFTMTRDRSSSGVPISYWTPPDRPDLLRRLREAPAAVDWVEQHLGPYPFDSLGFLVVDSQSGMETQTMITLGDTGYATSPEVLVHEVAHQWYGDEVTPVDWRDVWMNEGMAMYLQAVWTGEHGQEPLESILGEYYDLDAHLRALAGPPADFDPDAFGSSNIYLIPAVMWDELRTRIGDDEFWSLVRKWPAVHEDGNADYVDITSWWSQQTGEDLSDFFDSWLLGDRAPQRS